MFGIGMQELLLILGVALIVVGPSKLPDLAKSLAKGLKEFQKATDDVKATINEHEGLRELKDLKDSVKGTVDSLKPGNLLDAAAKSEPAVAPVVEMKKFETPAAAGSADAAEVSPVAPALEPKAPQLDPSGRLAVMDQIASEHAAAAQDTAPSPAVSATPAASSDAPSKANA